ncbi:MAG: hypothetical protein E3J73_04330 [Candidatus Bathyarchaeum sp.]|nr:MAG: hypothetical protein E3J73_04330 [Candidatus Bathyarchaeum sp.]
MSDSQYRIRVKRGDFELEVQGDRQWVEKKFEELTSRDAITSLETQVLPTRKEEKPKGGELPVSLAEFLKQRGNPQQHAVLVVLFGYWLFHKENTRAFNVRDISSCYNDARIPESTNTSQYLNNAQADGYFKRVEEKKDGFVTWTITPTGEKYIEK